MKIDGSCRSNGTVENKNLFFTYDTPTVADVLAEKDAAKKAALTKAIDGLARSRAKVLADSIARKAVKEVSNPTAEQVKAAATAVAGIDWLTALQSARGGIMSETREKLALGEILASGNRTLIEQAIPLGKSTDRAGYEKFLRTNAPETFAKKVKKATAPKVETK